MSDDADVTSAVDAQVALARTATRLAEPSHAPGRRTPVKMALSGDPGARREARLDGTPLYRRAREQAATTGRELIAKREQNQEV